MTESLEEREAREKLLERVARVRTRLVALLPFWGHLALKMQICVTTDVPTAGVTRDRQLLLNPDFCTALPEEQLAGLLCHETGHLAFLTFERQGERTAMMVLPSGSIPLWNVATDYAINDIIVQMATYGTQVELPSGGLVDEVFRDWSAEEIYDHLLDKMPQLPPIAWGGDDMRPGGEGGSAATKALDNYWKVAVCEAAIVQARSGQGTLPAQLQKHLDSIRAPKINWKDALSRWVGENGVRADFTYRRPSRRSEAVGEVLPYLRGHGAPNIVVLWDTSGSMDGRETEIISEVLGICEDLRMSLRVICCDSEVHSDQSNVENPEDVDVLGGGGSDFTPAFERLKDEGCQDVVVAFTDGYISVPGTIPPQLQGVLWVLWAGRDVDPTQGRWGETLVVDSNGDVCSWTGR